MCLNHCSIAVLLWTSILIEWIPKRICILYVTVADHDKSRTRCQEQTSVI